MSRQQTNLEKASRRALIAAGVAAFILLIALLLLGWRLLLQERAIEEQQSLRALGSAAGLVVADLKTRDLEIRSLLAGIDRPSNEDLTSLLPQGLNARDFLLVGYDPEGGWSAVPANRIVYWPEVESPEVEEELFRPGEFLEFRRKDLPRAINAYRPLASSNEGEAKIGALFRMARCWRKMGHLDRAIELYSEIARSEPVNLRGVASPILALDTLAELAPRNAELKVDANRRLLEMLFEKGWRISRAGYEYYLERALTRLEGAEIGVAPSESQLLLSEALDQARESISVRLETDDRGGTMVYQAAGKVVVEMFHVDARRKVSLFIGPATLRELFLGKLLELLESEGAKLALTDARGRSVYGDLPPEGGLQAVRSPAATGLPWTVHVFAGNPGRLTQQIVNRSWLLGLGGLVVLVSVVASGSVAYRALRKELRVTRLQSNFVAAVSHEFRSPLTSIRQMTEMLATGRIVSEDRRRRYYEVIEKESRRLSRMVETLLDFGRMEAGEYRYQREHLDLRGLLSKIIADFRSERRDSLQVHWKEPDRPLLVNVDRDALSLAVWNLLENGFKYSPDSPRIEVEATRDKDWVSVRIRDNGLGISAQELSSIAGKFVRGEAARKTGAKGTGIGLALVDEVVRAHAARLEISSKPDAGTCVSLHFPAVG